MQVPSPMLALSYRKRQLEFRRKQIGDWLEHETELLKAEAEGGALSEDAIAQRLIAIEKEARRQDAEALGTFGMLNGADPEIAPLRRALAVWGLTIDDVGVVSFHGTSTQANDKNESNAYNEQFKHLGRSKGNAVCVIAQKWLTGHPKGAAAAWMMNGMVQTIQSGLIPGNRNADNISPELRKFEYLVYPSRSIQTDGIKAGLLTSFGFGQVGGQALIVHPSLLLGSLEPAAVQSYKLANLKRRDASYRRFNDVRLSLSFSQLMLTSPRAVLHQGEPGPGQGWLSFLAGERGASLAEPARAHDRGLDGLVLVPEDAAANARWRRAVERGNRDQARPGCDGRRAWSRDGCRARQCDPGRQRDVPDAQLYRRRARVLPRCS